MTEDLERNLRKILNHRAKSDAERESLSQEIESLRKKINEEQRRLVSERENHTWQLKSTQEELKRQQELLSQYEQTLEKYKERLDERPSYTPSYPLSVSKPKKSIPDLSEILGGTDIELDNDDDESGEESEEESSGSEDEVSSQSDRDSSEDYSLPSVSEVRKKLEEFRARDGKLGKMVGLSLGLLGPIAMYKGFKLNGERREYLANLEAKCNAASGRDASEILELIERGYDELKEDNKFRPMGSKDDD